MSVVSMVVGATSPSGAVFACKVDTGPVRVAVSLNSGMTSPVFFGPVAVNAQGVAKVTAAGLDPGTRYWWRTEDNGTVDTSVTGTFRTLPAVGLPASFTVAAASCAGASPTTPGAGGELAANRVSNHAIFDTIRARAVDEDWLQFVHLGDIHYYDLGSGSHGISGGGSLANYRAGFDDVLAQSNQAGLYRELATAHVWDDHDYGPNNSDGTLATKGNAAQVYRERWPHYPLADASGIWQAWQIGRVQCLASDVRFYRSPNSDPDPAGLLLPGTNGNYATTPDHASLDITGDLDIRVEAAVPWAGPQPDGVRAILAGKWVTSGNQRSYSFTLENNGNLSLFWSANGSTSIQRTSTATVPHDPGVVGAVRVTLDVDNGASGHTVTFYHAPTLDGPWITFGEPVVTAGTTSIFSGSAEASVGAVDSGTNRPMAGVIRRAQIRNGIGGTIVANPNFTAQNPGTTSFADSTGKTWTVNGTARTIIDKTMLGPAQKAWLADLLANSTAEVLVWFMADQWLGTGTDTWGQFQLERGEIAALLAEHGWAGRMVMVYGDHHGVGIDSGQSNSWGGFPVLMAASLDSSPSSAVPGRFDTLADTPGREQYGTVTVTDLGAAIMVTLTAWRGDEALGSFTKSFAATDPTVQPAALIPTLSGSHRPTFEARVLTSFQFGDNPAGTMIPILGGDVAYDATAQVFANLSLETSGLDERRRSMFPRRAADLLAPYGSEIFVRRGVDVGSEVLWVPLGYFRIDTVEQGDDSSQPIRLSGQDRMAGIVDARLTEPLQFDEDRTVLSVIDELVRPVYPQAVIVVDDVAGQSTLGRSMVVEEDRYQALLDIAESLGKVVFWDGAGILRIEDPPDLDEITWEINAGRNGVLVSSARQVSREGMANGVLARGEGASEMPVRALVVDSGANSPTRWGGRFGRVPHFYTSPLITTSLQAASAASSLLRRRIGMPYSVNWGSVTNPALRPRDVVRITQLDGNREKHIVQTLTVPLVVDAAMRGTTREQTLVSMSVAT